MNTRAERLGAYIHLSTQAAKVETGPGESVKLVAGPAKLADGI